MTPVRIGRGRVVHVSSDGIATLCKPTAVRLVVSEDAVPDCKRCLRALIERR